MIRLLDRLLSCMVVALSDGPAILWEAFVNNNLFVAYRNMSSDRKGVRYCENSDTTWNNFDYKQPTDGRDDRVGTTRHLGLIGSEALSAQGIECIEWDNRLCGYLVVKNGINHFFPGEAYNSPESVLRMLST